MRTPSLRVSLTLWFVGLATLVLGASSAALYLGVRSSLLAGLDAELRARAEGVAALCEWEDGEIVLEGAAESGIEMPLLGPGHAIEIRRWPDLTLARAFGPALPDPRAADADACRTIALSGGVPHRLCGLRAAFPSVAAEDEARPAFEVLVRVAAPLAPVQRQLDRISWLSLGIGGLSLAVVVGFGFFLSRRVTRPLKALGTAADAVRGGAAAGMPRRGNRDEIDQLAEVLDETFGALRAAMEEQRRFTADASHELRTPVAILQSQSEVALRRARTPDEYVTTLEEIHATARRMGRILEALLTLTRLDAGGVVRQETVDLAEVARAAVDVARGRSDRSVALTGTGSAPIRGDEDLLRILLDNLLTNAARHAERVLVVDVRRVGEAVELTVRDDGPGIPADERPRVFERFFRGANANGHAGAGLGLALVAAIARVHGGTCEIEDAAPGLLVRVRLPASAASRTETSA